MRFAPEPQMPLCPIRTQELRIRASQRPANRERPDRVDSGLFAGPTFARQIVDRKSTRLNSSHGYISYAVFCLKKKNQTHTNYSSLPPQPSESSALSLTSVHLVSA